MRFEPGADCFAGHQSSGLAWIPCIASVFSQLGVTGNKGVKEGLPLALSFLPAEPVASAGKALHARVRASAEGGRKQHKSTVCLSISKLGHRRGKRQRLGARSHHGADAVLQHQLKAAHVARGQLRLLLANLHAVPHSYA